MAAFSLVMGVIVAIRSLPQQASRYGRAPVQGWRTAAGRSHTASPSSTEARAALKGRKRRSVVGPVVSPEEPAGALPLAKGAPKPRVTSKGTRAEVAPTGSKSVPVKGFDPKTSRELPARRNDRTRTFANADGTQTTEVYSRRVNFRRGNGSWARIDTTLVPRKAGSGFASPSSAEGTASGWTEKSAEAKVDFAGFADAPALVSLRVDGSHRVAFGIDGATHVIGRAQGSEVSYAGVRPDAGARFTAGNGQVKERLVLKSAAPSTWVFPLRLKGLRARMGSDGDVLFVDGSGTEPGPGRVCDLSYGVAGCLNP